MALEVNSKRWHEIKALYDIDDVGFILGLDLSTVKTQCSFASRGLDEKPWERYLKLRINTATGDFSRASRTLQHHTAFSQTWLWLYLQHFSNQTRVFSGISSGYLVAASLKAEIAETWRLEAQAKAGKWPRWWIAQDGKLEYRSACYSYDLLYLYLDYSGSYIINDEMMRMMMVKKVHLAFTPAVKYIAKIPILPWEYFSDLLRLSKILVDCGRH